MARWTFWVLVAAGLALSACDKPDSQAQNRAACANGEGTPGERIAACGALIDAGGLSETDHAAALANRGFAHSATRQPTAALRDFNAALALNADDTHAKLGRAMILAESGQLDAALPLAEELIRKGEYLDQAYYIRGNVKARMGDPQGAIADFDQALSRNGRMVEALAYRGRLRQEAAAYGPARSDFDAALQIDHRNAVALAGRCWNRIYQDQDVSAARADAEAAARADANLMAAHLCLGFTLLRQEQWTDARAAYEAALRLEPASAAALYGRGIARMRSGEREPGDADIDRAYEFNSRIDREFSEHGVRR